MNLYDNSANLGKLFQGGKANNLLANLTSLGASPDLTVKKPLAGMPDLGNIQAAYSSASTIESIFGSSKSAANPLMQFTSMMPQMSAMNNFFSPSISAGATSNAGGYFDQSSQIASSMSQTNWMNNLTASSIGLGGLLSMPSMPTVNTGSLGNAPVTMDSFIVGLGVAMGMIDPSTMDAAALNSLGLGTSTSTAQPTDSQAAAMIKKMPVVSAAKTEEVLNKSIDRQMSWNGTNQNISLITSDGSGATMLNAALSNSEDKASFIRSLSSNIDKEVRLAGRGASKEVVAEVLANELYSLYEKKNSVNAKDMERNYKGYKEKVLTGLKNIALGNVKANNQGQQSFGFGLGIGQSQLPEGVQEALQILPGISNKESNPDNNWGGGGWGGRWGGDIANDSRIKLLQETTNNLTAAAKENLIKKNSLG